MVLFLCQAQAMFVPEFVRHYKLTAAQYTIPSNQLYVGLWKRRKFQYNSLAGCCAGWVSLAQRTWKGLYFRVSSLALLDLCESPDRQAQTFMPCLT